MDNNSIIADTFEGDEVTLGYVTGVEADGGMAVGVGLHLGIPVKRGAVVGTRLQALVGVLR